MSREETICLHVDGGEGIGLGHATRGLGLAEGLRQLGFRTVFLVKNDPKLTDFLRQHGAQTVVCERFPDDLIDRTTSLDAPALVVDSYQWTSEDLRILKNDLDTVICFDDHNDRAYPIDIVVNGAPAAENGPYRSTSKTQLLLGPRYQIVRPEFTQEVERDHSKRPERILVTVGGDDVGGILHALKSFFVEQFLPNHPGTKVEFVLGPFMNLAVREDLQGLVFHHNPDDMRALMVRADIAVSAGGQTLYELARCALPTIGFEVSEDQRGNLCSLSDENCILHVGRTDSTDWLDQLSRALERLMSDPKRRRQLGDRAKTYIDGRGALRVARAIRERIQRED